MAVSEEEEEDESASICGSTKSHRLMNLAFKGLFYL